MLSKVTVFVPPSLKERLFISLWEATACGKPVIVTIVGDVPVLVKNYVNGMVIPPGNADLLAEGII